MTASWQDRVPEELIEALVHDDEFVAFTDAWRDLDEQQQITQARYWLRRALGMEVWR